jgi:hypothetical protein
MTAPRNRRPNNLGEPPRDHVAEFLRDRHGLADSPQRVPQATASGAASEASGEARSEASPQAGSSPLGGRRPKRKRRPPAWTPRHEAVLVLVLTEPGLRRQQVAERTGYSRWQVSRIARSPDFRERYNRAIDRRLEYTLRRQVRRGLFARP